MSEWHPSGLPEARVRQLCERAHMERWQAERALDWSALELDRIATPIRRAMAEIYGDVLFAESFGVHLAERLVQLAPEGCLRDFARTQVTDEQRHVAFFAEVVGRLGGAETSSPQLRLFSERLAPIGDYDELLLHMQVLELAAQAVFLANAKRSLKQLERGVRLPGSESLAALLGCIVHNVGQDESRHIAFGTQYLSHRLRACGASRRRELCERATDSAHLIHSAFVARRAWFARFGFSPDELLAQGFLMVQRHLERLGLQIDRGE